MSCCKYDKDLRKHTLVQFIYIPVSPIPIPHVMMVKLKLYTWSTNDIVDKLESTISLVCFVPMIKKDAVEINEQLEKVTVNAQINQPEAYRSRIECTIHKSYKVNSSWGVTDYNLLLPIILVQSGRLEVGRHMSYP